MKIIAILLLALFSSTTLAQTSYEKTMQKTLTQWANAQNMEDFTAIAHQFDRIAAKDTDKWEPQYYSILVRTVQAFSLPKNVALEAVNEVEEDYNKLILLENNSEVKVLKGLYETVKISKDPMVYGRTLSASVTQTYQEALAQNPNNPRALFGLAQFEMGAAQFWGKDPKDSCPKIEKALKLFKAENDEDSIQPTWGLEDAQKLWISICK